MKTVYVINETVHDGNYEPIYYTRTLKVASTMEKANEYIRNFNQFFGAKIIDDTSFCEDGNWLTRNVRVESSIHETKVHKLYAVESELLD